MALIEGKEITVGGEKMTLPPLNWKSCKKFYRDITQGQVGPEQMGEMVHTALARNYPDLTLDDLESRISPGELLAAIPLLMEVSGFEPREKPGEQPGEGQSPIGTA